jgi:phage terminase small subunit
MPGGLKKKELRTELDLTPKQKMFVEIYVKDWGSITQAEALKRAGYVCTNEKDYSSVASRMLSRKLHPHIAKYFDKLFEREVKKYTSDNLRRYKRLERIADKAEEEKQFAAAINAEYRSGQLAGAYVDKKEITVSGLEGMSREQGKTPLQSVLKLYRPVSLFTEPRSLVPRSSFSAPYNWTLVQQQVLRELGSMHSSA